MGSQQYTPTRICQRSSGHGAGQSIHIADGSLCMRDKLNELLVTAWITGVFQTSTTDTGNMNNLGAPLLGDFVGTHGLFSGIFSKLLS